MNKITQKEQVLSFNEISATSNSNTGWGKQGKLFIDRQYKVVKGLAGALSRMMKVAANNRPTWHGV